MTPLLTKLLAGQLVPVDAAVSSNMMDVHCDSDDKQMYSFHLFLCISVIRTV